MPSPGSRGVLIVEAESIVALDLRKTLLELGFDAFGTASSAKEALARSGERRPDVALVDVRIKGRIDGIKTAQMLRERFGIPIVYLTEHADDATLVRALETHPDAYLLKPVKASELRSALEIALAGQEADEPGRGSGASFPKSMVAPPMTRDVQPPPAEAVRQLEQILASPDFDAPRRSREFLRFVVEEAVAGRGDAITQTTLATQVFDRKDDFDATVDPIVRIQAGRLRRSLERYYLLSGKQDAVRIEMPKGGYVPVFRGATPAVAGATRANEPQGAARDAEAAAVRAGDGWPTVVVSGFEAVGPEAQELALEVRDELALELGRYRAVRVRRQGDIGGREPSPTGGDIFGLEGRIHRDGEGWRMTARLVDRTTGEQVWGDKYYCSAPRPQRWSGSPDDVARVIAARVAAEEGVIIQQLAAERRRHRPVEPTPYDAILLSYEFFLARDSETFLPAVEALRRLVAAEPECGLAWTRLARLYLANHAFEVTPTSTPIDEAITYAQRGVRVDPASRSARCMLASALLIKGELAAGREQLEQALRSSPRSLVYLDIIGYLLTLLGDWERGPALSRSARERNPHCLPHVLFGMWADALRRGDAEQAYQAALEYGDPTFFWPSVMRASCLGLLGRTSEATSEVTELLSYKPDFPARGRVLIGYYIKFDEVMSRIVDGLARAGLKLA